MLLDVRPKREYNNGHIPKAINIPPDELSSRLKKLPKNKEYIAYCRGPFCVFADEAVSMLSKKGFKARRLVEGFPDWKSRGLKIEVVRD
jgi:rhodanese-related sulfurtransferase